MIKYVMRRFLVFFIVLFVVISVYAVSGLSLIQPKYKYVIKQGVISVDNYDKLSYLKVEKVCDEDFSAQDFEKELARSKLSGINFFVYSNNNVFNCNGIEYFKNFFVKNDLKSALLINIEDIYLIKQGVFEWVNYWIFRIDQQFNIDTQIQVYQRIREIYPKAQIGFYLVKQDETKIKEISEYYADILILDNDKRTFVRPYIVWEKDQLPENFIFDGYLFR